MADAPRLDGLRVLVVDDEEDARPLVREVLREQGAEVHVAASALEGLHRRALPPDQGGRTPAVALTAYARAEDAQRAFAAGYQMHVAKPVEAAQLATVVANLGGRTQDGA